MSFPNIPNITPTISLSRTDVINLLLASIALEELGISHIINAEAEKIQAAIGTIPGVTTPGADLPGLINLDNSVRQMIKTLIKEEMLLEFKLEEIIGIPEQLITVHQDTATVTANFEGGTVTDSDAAYYFTEP